MKITDWDDAYANRDHVPGAQALIDRWPGDAARFRAGLPAERARLGLAYGPGERERLDLFLPDGPPAGLMIFIHGGYWLFFDRGDWSHFAAGGLARGYAVAMIGYPLAPAARLPEISAATGAAVAAAAAEVAGPIHLTGHSAGGHLAARMACAQGPLPEAVRDRLATVVPISGLFDLRPLLRLRMNDDWRLTAATARDESPAWQDPAPAARYTAWVGGAERPEFLRQNALLANAWAGCGVDIRAVEDPGAHHFDVIDGLREPQSPLMQAVLG